MMMCTFFCRDRYAYRLEEKGKFYGIISIHDFHLAGMRLSPAVTKGSDLRSASSLLQMGSLSSSLQEMRSWAIKLCTSSKNWGFLMLFSISWMLGLIT